MVVDSVKSVSHRHRKVLEKVVDIDYVLKVRLVLYIYFSVIVFHHLFFFMCNCLFSLFLSSFSRSHRQSVSLMNASPLWCLVIKLVRTITTMPVHTKDSPVQRCPSCVSTLLMTPSLPTMVSRQQEKIFWCNHLLVQFHDWMHVSCRILFFLSLKWCWSSENPYATQVVSFG